MKIITTSWDDGHPADFRLAELLSKYNIKGTLYIPFTNAEHAVMTEQDVVSLSKDFEIGGHTINHVRINTASLPTLEKEIKGCYHWLSDLLGSTPNSFCFPGGVYNPAALNYTYLQGFNYVRSTELLNLALNKTSKIHPTTIQVYPHSIYTYCKHLLKRNKYKSLLLYFKSGRPSNLVNLVDFYINYLLKNDGCFHLWGHSWEIEEFGLWNVLEDILREISGIHEVDYVENRDLIKYKN